MKGFLTLKKCRAPARSSEPKSSWKLNLALLWFSQLLIMAGFDALIPFIPLFIKNELGVVDNAELAAGVALFNSLGAAAYALMCPVWGVLGDRFGMKPMLLRGCFVTAIFFPMMGYVHSVGMLALLRFVTAACAGTTSASQAMVARDTPNEHQGFAQGLLTTAIWGGAMLGNVLGGFLIHYFNFLVAFWVCGIMYAVGGIAVLFTHERHIPQSVVHRTAGGMHFPRFTHGVLVMIVLFFLCGFLRKIEAPFVALKIETLVPTGTADYWTGIVSALVCVGAILAGGGAGYLVDRCKPAQLLIPMMLISGATLFMQGVTASLVVFTAARVLLYVAAGGLGPLLQKTLSDITPARKRASVFGLTAAANSIGVGAVSWVGGWSMMLWGVCGVFVVGAVLTILSLPVFTRGIRRATRHGAGLAARSRKAA